MRLLWFERTTAGPRWDKWRQRRDNLDLWLEKYLDIGEMLHGLEHHWRTSLVAGLVLLLGLWGLSGLVVIAPDEVAVVRRFGSVEADLEPGWHWRWPWPIEDVVRVSQRIQTVEIGFRDLAGKSKTLAPLTCSSTPIAKKPAFPDESLMITGDGNLIDVQAVVHYKIVKPRVFLFEVRDPSEVLREGDGSGAAFDHRGPTVPRFADHQTGRAAGRGAPAAAAAFGRTA